MFSLKGSPYSLEPAAAAGLASTLAQLHERVDLLRRQGTLTDATLRDYYGETRFDQIAESNAIEGSTLDVGETRLAVLKGTTLTGHDPAYVRDAVALGNALERLEQLARLHKILDLDELFELHRLIFGERPGGGIVRDEPVEIAGSPHKPPRTNKEILVALTAWVNWSLDNPAEDPVFRATVLHAWFTHIHPFVDGNGRTARALTTLELVRGGYPPLIVRKTRDRGRYVEALAHSDAAGDLGPLLDLFIERATDATRDLERAATRQQGFDPVAARLRVVQEQRLKVFLTSVHLLAEMIQLELDNLLQRLGGRSHITVYADALDVDDYVMLCSRNPAGNRWAFRLQLEGPALKPLRRLAWIGYRSKRMDSRAPGDRLRGPSVFWSVPNPAQYPAWLPADEQSPSFSELATFADRGDVLLGEGVSDRRIRELRPSEVAHDIAAALVDQLEQAQA